MRAPESTVAPAAENTACRAGFFVDWDGNTRRTEAPGLGMSCTVMQRELEGEPYLGVDVLDHEDFVIHEATFFPSIESLEQMGITVRLVA